MTTEPLPPAIRQFVARYVHSVASLEIILLVRAHATKQWSAEAVAQHAGTHTEVAAAALDAWCAHGFLAVRVANALLFQYSPSSPDLERGVADLADAYARQRDDVVGLIHPPEFASVRAFADAFRIRRES